MSGTSDSDLSAGDNRITPSVDLSEISFGDDRSGDVEVPESDGELVYKYDVDELDGTTVLEIFGTHESADLDWLPFSIPKDVYVLVAPDGTPRPQVGIDQGRPEVAILCTTHSL